MAPLLTGCVLATSGCFDPGSVMESASEATGGGTSQGTGGDDGDADGGDAAGDAADAGDSEPTGGGSDADGTADGNDGDDTDTDTDTGTPAGCGTGSTCLAIPEGFSVVATWSADAATPAPDCGGAYAQPAFSGNAGLLAEAAECECECQQPAGVTCPDATMSQFPAGVQNCAILVPENVEPLVAGCNDIAFYDDVRLRLDMPDLDLTGVSCDPVVGEQVPPTQWTQQLVGCEPAAAPAACDAGACIPELDDPQQRLCVWAPGDVECSGDVFTDREVVYQDVDDSRGCSACTCGQAEGSCTGTMTLRAGEACTVGSPGSGIPGECISIETPARSAELQYAPPDVSCAPAGGQAEGAATPADAVTVCCTP